MSTIKKIALAILNSDREAAGFPPVESRDGIPDSDGYVRNATAVLLALRTPSETMVEAGNSVLTEIGCNPVTGDEIAVWQAMIDAALTEDAGL
jgi:hypothetical protein